MQRLSDYFTCWKLKVLLGQTIQDASSPSNGSPVFSPNKGCLLDDGEELQLDFSTWRREITANEQAR